MAASCSSDDPKKYCNNIVEHCDAPADSWDGRGTTPHAGR